MEFFLILFSDLLQKYDGSKPLLIGVPYPVVYEIPARRYQPRPRPPPRNLDYSLPSIPDHEPVYSSHRPPTPSLDYSEPLNPASRPTYSNPPRPKYSEPPMINRRPYLPQRPHRDYPERPILDYQPTYPQPLPPPLDYPEPPIPDYPPPTYSNQQPLPPASITYPDPDYDPHLLDGYSEEEVEGGYLPVNDGRPG